jgi:peptide/nickel transport system permease protein
MYADKVVTVWATFGPLSRLILRNLALGVLTLLVVSALIFAGTEILPGDVATAILGNQATPDALEAIRTSLHLHDPPITRYWRWLSDFLHGDIGISLANRQPVFAQVTYRLNNTLFLGALTALFAVPLSLVFGILSAIYQDRAFDRIFTAVTLTFISFPEFFIGYILILVLAVQLGWFPSLATVSDGMTFGQRVHTVGLPVITLTISVLAHMARMTRTTIIGVMSEPYIEMAYLNGASRTRVVVQHALPNAIGPIVTVIALNLAYLVVGVVVVEVVFAYPGLGQLMVDAVSSRDVPVVQACGLLFGAVYIGLNLLADVVSVAADPRLRKPK